MNAVPTTSNDTTTARRAFSIELAELRALPIDEHTAVACSRYLALYASLEAMALPMRHALLTTPLAWTSEERRDAIWLDDACEDLAALGHRVAMAASQGLGMRDERTIEVAATALQLMGDAAKWDISTAPSGPHDLKRVHALLVAAIAAKVQHRPLTRRVEGRPVTCTLEALYFRVLLLTRFASGALNIRQIEILDAWLWLWMPTLRAVALPPTGAALRADLDSSTGLQRGPRQGDGPSLYLPQQGVEEGYRRIVASFHAGRIVPAEGIASEFRIEEHVAVLDLIAKGLGESKRAQAARAPRVPGRRTLELHVGIGEILAGAAAPASPPASIFTLSVIERAKRSAGQPVREESPLEDIYLAHRRLVDLNDQSHTGLGLEGTASECGSLAAGDLVAVRLAEDAPLTLGKVVRSTPAAGRGRVVIGVRRLTSQPQAVDVVMERGTRSSVERLLYVPGDDNGGLHDAWIVPERAFAEKPVLRADIGGMRYTLKLNRIRDRGRGWILAGFEVVSATEAQAIEIA